MHKVSTNCLWASQFSRAGRIQKIVGLIQKPCGAIGNKLELGRCSYLWGGGGGGGRSYDSMGLRVKGLVGQFGFKISGATI